MIVYYSLSFILTFFLILVFKKIAIKFNIVDKPNLRKIHKNPKPLLGGVAIFISIFISYSIYLKFEYSTHFIMIAILMFLLVLMGFLDDYLDLSAVLKLFIQLLISFLVSYIMGGINKLEIYGMVVDFNMLTGVILETIWMVALINAFNLIDGLDGLSAGMGVISLSSLAIIASLNQNTTNLAYTIIVIGALLAFLYFNFYPSTIFLGDSGSMFLGMIVAILSINGNKTITMTTVILLLLIVFMPFLDVILAIIRRKKNKQKAFEADSLHFHHRLMRQGYSHMNAVLILYSLTLFYAVSAIMIDLFFTIKIKIIILILILIITIYVFEKLYLLSDRYAYISKALKKIKRGH